MIRISVAVCLVVLGVWASVIIGEPVDEPLTLDGPLDGPATTQPAEPADNSYCLTCHINFQDEHISAQHQVAGVGCAKCHGASEKHSADEDGLTAPDIMYPKDRITSLCADCHKLDVLEKDNAHDPLLTNKATAPFRYCTDCHGRHIMAHRTRIWDKVSRKLLSDDGVRMLTQPAGAGSGEKEQRRGSKDAGR